MNPSTDLPIRNPIYPWIYTNTFIRYCSNCSTAQRISLNEGNNEEKFIEYHSKCSVPIYRKKNSN